MAIEKNLNADIRDRLTNGEQAARVINKNKSVVNEVVDIVNKVKSAAFKDEGYFLTPQQLQTLLSAVAFSNDYQDLTNKPDLSAVAGMQTYDSLGDFPLTGIKDVIYVASDSGKLYAYTAGGYVSLTNTQGVWGNIQGNLEDQSDIISKLNKYVLKESGKSLFSGLYDDLEDKPTLGTASDKDITQSLTETFSNNDVPTNKAVVDLFNSIHAVLNYVQGSGIIIDGNEISVDDNYFGAMAFMDTSDFISSERLSDLDNAVTSDMLAEVATSGAFEDLTGIEDVVQTTDGKIDSSLIDKTTLALTTNDVSEGSRKYFTEQRVKDVLTQEGVAKDDDLNLLADDVSTNYAKKSDIKNSLISFSVNNVPQGSFNLNQDSPEHINMDFGESSPKTFAPWQPEVIEGTGSPVTFTIVPDLSSGGGYSQNENVFTFSPIEENEDDFYLATWKANVENVPEKYSITFNKVSTDPNATVIGYYSGVVIGDFDSDNEIYPTVGFNYMWTDDDDPTLLAVDNYMGDSIVDPAKTFMNADGFGAITAPMPSQGMDVTLAIDNSALSASIFYDGVLQGTVYLLEPLIPDSIWVSTYGLVSEIGETATVTLVDRVVEDYIPFTIYGFGDSAIDESKYPQNREGKGYEIIDLAAPAYWNELGKEVKNGDFIVFDNAGMPKEVGEEVDLSDYATKTYVDNAVNEVDLSEYTKRSADETITGDWEFTGGISVGDAKFGVPFKPNFSPTALPAAFSFNSTENVSVNLFDVYKGTYSLMATRTGTDWDNGNPIDGTGLLIGAEIESGDMTRLALFAHDSEVIDASLGILKSGISYDLGIDKNGKGYLGVGGSKKYLATEDFVKDSKIQAKEILTANKTLTAADSGKLLIINADGITITMPANSDFNIDIAKMDERFITIVQSAGTDSFREGTDTISVIRDVSITNSDIAGKEWLAIGAYEV